MEGRKNGCNAKNYPRISPNSFSGTFDGSVGCYSKMDLKPELVGGIFGLRSYRWELTVNVREELLKMYSPEQIRQLELVREKLVADPKALDTRKEEVAA